MDILVSRWLQSTNTFMLERMIGFVQASLFREPVVATFLHAQVFLPRKASELELK